MAQIYDQWHKSRPAPGEPRCEQHGLVPSAGHMKGDRWQARWYDGGVQRKASFDKRTDAERHLKQLSGGWCIVSPCKHSAVTEPPVLLCADHRDMLISQCTRRRPQAHDSVVYFIRNGSRIKIGWTTNVKKRIFALSLPADSLELQIDGGPEEEDIMHRRFAKARVGRSEWFEATPELLEFIEQRREAEREAGRWPVAS